MSVVIIPHRPGDDRPGPPLTEGAAAQVVRWMMDLWPTWKPAKVLADQWISFLVSKKVTDAQARAAIQDHLQTWKMSTPNMAELAGLLAIRRDLQGRRMGPAPSGDPRGDYVVFCESHPRDEGITRSEPTRMTYGPGRIPDKATQEVHAANYARSRAKDLGGVWKIRHEPIPREGKVTDHGRDQEDRGGDRGGDPGGGPIQRGLFGDTKTE